MLNLFLLLLASHAAGVVLPLCLPGRPRLQNLLAHGLACSAGLLGIVLGVAGLVAR